MTEIETTLAVQRVETVAKGNDVVLDPAAEAIQHIGATLRRARVGQGLTLRDVAVRTGVSLSMLSMIERGVASASVGTLVAVASALNLHMADLFEAFGAERQRGPVTRRENQPVIESAFGARRRLIRDDRAAGLELVVNTYLPGGASGPTVSRHNGRECGLVLAGQITVELEGQVHVLEEGDSIAYPSTRLHRICNQTDTVAEALWLNIDR